MKRFFKLTLIIGITMIALAISNIAYADDDFNTNRFTNRININNCTNYNNNYTKHKYYIRNPKDYYNNCKNNKNNKYIITTYRYRR